jgi:hypothetical protein
MRTMLRAGAIALAASSILLSGGVAAHAASGLTFSVGDLVFDPAEHGHTGTLDITIVNDTNQDYVQGLTINEPIARSFYTTPDELICGNNERPDGRWSVGCTIDPPIPAGATRTLSISFRSPAAPKAFARQATATGSVEVAGVTKTFPALYRSTSGSLTDPVPYTPASTEDLTATTPDAVTLTRQEDGTFSGHIPVTVHNGNDAPHSGWQASMAVPAGVDFPYATDGSPCFFGVPNPTPPAGGQASGCSFEGLLAEGETRTVDWVLSAPEGTQPGTLGTATVLAQLETSLEHDQPNGANETTFTVTVAD